ncbi:hypothetical protein JW707_05340 [Candidatus Woesearchaeota archaeon]|nr:hypothetical protein [Candidatus Woesearchaeota archaeon]
MIPNVLSKQEIPDKIPKEMQKIVRKLKKCRTKKECLQEAYNAVVKNHFGSMLGIITYFPAVFIMDISKLWKTRNLHCHSMSYLLRVLLIKSGRFNEKDIKQKLIFTHWFIHIFLVVNLGKKWVNVDPWAKNAVKKGIGYYYDENAKNIELLEIK